MSKENRHIANEVRKSGFPLEIEIAETLEKSGWEVQPSLFYPDYDDGDYKEVDIAAHKHVFKNQSSEVEPYNISVSLVIECKKREGIAWVFFPRERNQDDLGYHGVGLASVDSFRVARLMNIPALYHDNLPRSISLGIRSWKFLSEGLHKQLWGPSELNIVHARDFSCLAVEEKSSFFDVVKVVKQQGGKFNRESERKQIHSAFTGLAKAVEHRLLQTADFMQMMLQSFVLHSDTNPEFRTFWLYYSFPVLVFDGKLKVWRNGEVTDTQQVLFDVALRTHQYHYNRLINIVSKEHFPQWLARFEEDSKSVAKKILSNREKLDAQIELIEKNKSPPTRTIEDELD